MQSLIEAADSLLPTSAPEVKAEEKDGALTLYHDSWPVAIIGDDYSEFIKFFGYDPEVWAVENQGTMSKWQQSKGNSDGTRDVIWLYSYKGVKFRKITQESLLTEEQFETAVENIRNYWAPIKPRLCRSDKPTVTHVVLQGDAQAGKSEGGGLAGLEQRLKDGLEKTLEEITRNLDAGHNIEAIADLNSGDIVENIFGHYDTQTVTAATMRAQYAFAVESEIRRIKALASFGLPVILPRTPSNHGEHRKSVGGRSITTESDNLDLQIAESVRRVLQETAINDQLEWIIPHDDPFTRFTLSGVDCILTHGHKIEKNPEAGVVAHHHAMLNEGYNPKIYFMGHKHHFLAKELGFGTSMIQSPSQDGGSPYFFNMTGKKNTPGLLNLLVGRGFKIGYGQITML